jgi:hypothetical protein
VVKHVDSVKVRIIVAAVLATATDAVLVAHHLPKLCAVYFIVVPRPLFAAAVVVRRGYLIVVPKPMPAAQRMYLIVVYRPLSVAPLVVRCMRGANTDACGRSFAVLSTQISTVGLRLRLKISAWCPG